MAERGYKNIRTAGEDLVEFSYRPRHCDRDYRVVALRKDLHVTGQGVLFNTFRYFWGEMPVSPSSAGARQRVGA